MFLKMFLREKRVVQLYTLLIFIVLAAGFLVITFYWQYNENIIQRSEIESNEQSLVEVEKTIIENKISGRLSDLLYINDSLGLFHVTDGNYAEVTEQWVAFSARKAVYDQIRYINLLGNEMIRINYEARGAVAASPDKRQNKAERYYFINTIDLLQNQIFVSQLDLNVENGEIETPIKPMLRLSTPFYTGDGVLGGITILNYTAQDLLDEVAAVGAARMGELYLLNLDGYWLYHSEDSGKAWAFMYEDRMDESFAAVFPQEWDAISAASSGKLRTDNGIFNFTSLRLDAAILGGDTASSVFCDSGVFYIVSYIPADSKAGLLFSESVPHLLRAVIVKNWSVYLLLTGIAFVLASFVGVTRAQRKEIKYYAEFDPLTGVYNRRAGYAKLNALQKDTTRKGCKIAVCFLDINGLKDVNDNLGHDMGDELIQTVVAVIKESVRGNDYVARLGGDEFLIVFDKLDAEGAEKVWQRIVQKFDAINEAENRKYGISASHGVDTFHCNAKISIDDAINRADEKMYQEKREIKRNFQVLR